MDSVFTLYDPECAGIPAGAVHSFLDRLEHYHINMHSILLMRHSRLVAEGYYAPFDKDTLHRMFSVSKTLNAIAVGLLEQEGKLDLDVPVLDYFPDMREKACRTDDGRIHPWIAEMTVRDLLMMRTCHASTTYKYGVGMEWVESFFAVPPTHKPGTVFHYDTSAAHVLCVLATRLCGMPMLDYLRKKCLDRIGWSKTAYLLQNEFGDPQGGSGLMALPRDMLLLGKLLMDGGRFAGEQLLPADFTARMTSLLTPNSLTGGVISEAMGYGYQLWRSRHNGFVCYGLGGQLTVCLPEQDMILVTCADTQGCGGGNDLIYNSFYETILPALDTCVPGPEEQDACARLRERLNTLALAPVKKWSAALPGMTNQTFLDLTSAAKRTDGAEWQMEDNKQGFSKMTLSFREKEGLLSCVRNGEIIKIPFGLDQCLSATLSGYDMPIASSGMWLAPDTFYIKIHIIGTSVGSIQMEFVFGEDDVTVFMRKIEETMFNEYSGHLYGRRED